MTGLRRAWPASASPAGVMKRCWLNSAGLAALMLCAAVVGVLGSTLHPRLLLLLPALAVLLVVGAVWPWLTVLLVRGRLHFARDRIHEGEEMHAALSLRQRAPWPAWGLLLDVDEANCLVLGMARPFSATDTSLELVPQHRGTFPMCTPRLRTGFPFGLLTASRRVAVNHSLVVWPRIFPVAAPPDWASADSAFGHVETRRVGSAGDTLGVREYRRGDPMRWIHWSQTARHDRFMVREFQATGVPRVCIVLDCNSDVHVGQGSNSSFEWAVRIAASLAAGWIDEGAEVGLLAGSLRLSAHGGHRHRIRVLDALAEVQTNHAERIARVPKTELTTVFISTDLGWQKRPEPPCCTWRGLMLRSQGFGGNRESAPASSGKVVAIERPDDVPAALLRVKRGLADVA